MSDKGEPVRWITVKGARIPVFADGSIGVGTLESKHKTSDLKDGDLMVFDAGKKTEKKMEIEIEKDAKKYTTFRLKTGFRTKYRMNKETGEIQVSPYWNVVKEPYIEDSQKKR